MRLSAAKINHIAHLIAEQLLEEESVECLHDKNDIRLRVKIIITDELHLDDQIDRKVRQTLKSLQRNPPEGSKEWEILYAKYYEEEMNRRRHASGDGIRRMN